MPNLAQTLKQEIARITRREINPMVKKQIVTVRTLKSQVATLKQQIADLQKGIAKGGSVPAGATTTAKAAGKPAVSFTGKSVRSQRTRLGLTQVAFAKRVGVSPQAVIKWEGKKGKLQLLEATQAKLAAVWGMAKA